MKRDHSNNSEFDLQPVCHESLSPCKRSDLVVSALGSQPRVTGFVSRSGRYIRTCVTTLVKMLIHTCPGQPNLAIGLSVGKTGEWALRPRTERQPGALDELRRPHLRFDPKTHARRVIIIYYYAYVCMYKWHERTLSSHVSDTFATGRSMSTRYCAVSPPAQSAHK
jgi:hypothetical protein